MAQAAQLCRRSDLIRTLFRRDALYYANFCIYMCITDNMKCGFINVFLVRRCPVPRCASPPLDACTEPNYKVIAGVRCFWCYKIVPCEKPEES